MGNADSGTVPAVPFPRFDTGRFCRRFLLIGSISLIIASLLPDLFLEPLCRCTAKGSSLLLEFGGVPSIVDNTIVKAGTFAVMIIPECTPLFMAVLFCSFVLAAPAPPRRKLPGIVAGITVLTVFNIIRIAASVAVGYRHPFLFDYAHAYFGQALMLLATWGVCMVWLRSILPAPAPGNIRPFLARFAAFSSLLFLAWLPLSKWYIRCGDTIVRTILSLFGLSLDVTYHRSIYFQTFSVTAFVALILATGSLSPRRKIAGILAGVPLLFLTHLLFRSCGIVLGLPGVGAFTWGTNFPLTVNKIAILLNAAGGLFIPIVIWLTIVATEKGIASASPRQADGTHPCPAAHPPLSRPISPWWR